MGRSSRSQGQGKGSFYLIGDKANILDGWEAIKARSSSQTNDGGLNLMRMFDLLPKVDISLQWSLDFNRAAYEDGAWQKDTTTWKRTHSAMHGFLTNTTF